jgi:hypothetical protein
MAIVALILSWWRAYQRSIDLRLLWPICKQGAAERFVFTPLNDPDDVKRRDDQALDYARAAFAVHAFNDPAWLTLGEDEIVRQIDALE